MTATYKCNIPKAGVSWTYVASRDHQALSLMWDPMEFKFKKWRAIEEEIWHQLQDSMYIYTYMNTLTYAYVYINTYIHACLYTVYTHTLWRKFLSSVLWDLGLLIIKWQKWKINYQVFINMWKLSRILFHKFTFNRKRKVIYLQIVLHVVNWAKLCCSFWFAFLLWQDSFYLKENV